MRLPLRRKMPQCDGVLLAPEYDSSLAACPLLDVTGRSLPLATAEKTASGIFFAPSAAHRKKRLPTHRLAPGCEASAYETASGRSIWKVYGPDLNGSYGGL